MEDNRQTQFGGAIDANTDTLEAGQAEIIALLNLIPVNEVAVKLAVTTSNQTATVVADGTVGYLISAVDGVTRLITEWAG